MPRPVFRTALRASSLALAAGLLTLGTAAPGRAAAGEPAMTFTIGTFGQGSSAEVEPYDEDFTERIEGHNTSGRTLKDVKVTVDLTALKGQLEMNMTTPCTQQRELVVTCTADQDLKADAYYVVAGMTFKVLPGARPGFSGEVRVSAEAAGTSLGTSKLTVNVSDEGVVVDRSGAAPHGTPMKPGGTVQPLAGFTNFSTRPVRDVYVTLNLTPGLAFAEEYSNCEYGVDAAAYRAMTCHIAQSIEPGAAYDLDLGSLKLTAAALVESWYGGIFTDKGAYEKTRLDSSHPGSGPELVAVPRAGGPAVPGHRGMSGGVHADNTLDFEAVGATLDGKAGQVVRAHLGTRNKGPATIKNWTGSEPGDEPTSETRVIIPPGTTVVKAPGNCRGDGSLENGNAGSKSYYCWQPQSEIHFLAGKLTPFDFDLRIDKPAALAPGKITMSHGKEDRNTKNDTAPITVTVDGKLGNGSSPSPSAPASHGPTTPPAASSGTTSGGAASGPLADTGAGTLPWYAAAAATALAAGTVLFTVTRRRRAGRV